MTFTIKEGLNSFYQNKELEEQREALKASYSKAMEEIMERQNAEHELQKAFKEN